ncbi:MAG: molybdopterin-dependent oxidoreductase [Burkholderiaceae bacterium]
MTTPLTETRSTCPYCGTGCGVIVQARGEQIVGVRGDPDHPANLGKLCPKGQALHLTATPAVIAQARLHTPQVRATRDAAFTPTNWEMALATAADRFAAAIREHGPDSVAFYVSGQLLTEDYYVFNKLARALVGTNNIDSNSRLCMSSAVVGYKLTLGADAPPCSYEDVELADCVFVAGANPALAHPVLFGRLLEARRRRGSKLIVADPRVSETALAADLHLQLAPGTDLYLLTALLGVMLRDGLVNETFIAAHTTGFAALAAQVRALPLAEAARITRVPAAAIERAARWFAGAQSSLSLWCQGLNQSSHGSDNSAALIHLHLACGQIGRAGTGPFSLTGQPNAMGGRETGSMATLLPGHRDPADPADRAALARFWRVGAVPTNPGLSAVELFDACRQGRIKALWVACTNPAQSMPTQTSMRAALATLPFLVVQEAFATETTALADLVLPAATWGERSGTMSNSERRISLSRAAVAPPGQARPDWAIAAAFARALAARIAPELAPRFMWSSPRAVFDEYKQLTAGRDLDIATLDYARLELGPVSWPYINRSGTERLYTDLRFATPDGRARFAAIALRGAAAATDSHRPIALTTVRLRDQWHGASRSGTALPLAPAALELAPATATELGLADDDLVRVTSAHGELILPLRLSHTLAPGLASLTLHQGERWLPGSLGINALTGAALDPLARQPELKHVPVGLTKIELAWHGALVTRLAADQIAPALTALRAGLAPLAHAAIGVFAAGEQTGLIALAAHHERPPALLLELAAIGAISPAAPVLNDARSGRSRVLQISAGRLAGVILEGSCRADLAAWPLYQKLITSGADCSARSLRELFAPELADS